MSSIKTFVLLLIAFLLALSAKSQTLKTLEFKKEISATNEYNDTLVVVVITGNNVQVGATAYSNVDINVMATSDDLYYWEDYSSENGDFVLVIQRSRVTGKIIGAMLSVNQRLYCLK